MLRALFVIALVASFCSVQSHISAYNPCKSVGFYPLTENESKFYGCYRNGAGALDIKYFDCPEGEIFNEEFMHCVSKTRDDSETTPNDVQKPTEPTEETSTTEGSGSGETETTTETEKSTETTEESPEETTQITDEPEETTQTTDEPSETTTEPDTTNDPETTVEGSGSTAEPETTQTTDSDTETTESPEEPSICPAPGFYPKQDTCSSFIVCIKNGTHMVAYEINCPNGQYFNPKSSLCEADYVCPIEETNENVNGFADVACLVDGAYAVREDCSKYFLCLWNNQFGAFERQLMQCPERQVFNRLTGQCGAESILTCLGRPKGSKYNHSL